MESTSSSDLASAPRTKVSTDSALYNDSTITLIGNPLQTLPAKELRCPKCGRHRLLHPTSGISSQPPDPEIEYCTKHPFIEKPGHDIYGQIFPIEATGPGKGKKKSLATKIGATENADSSYTIDSPAPSPPSSIQGSPTTFPNVKCPSCARPLAIKRFAAHLGKCIGGRPSSGRTAQLKQNNNTSFNSQNSNPETISTPPGSRRGTPIPEKKKTANLQKRELDSGLENEGTEGPKSKKRKLPGIKKKDGATIPASSLGKKWKSGKQTGVDGKIKLKLTNNRYSTPDVEPDGEFVPEKSQKGNLGKTESLSSQTASP